MPTSTRFLIARSLLLTVGFILVLVAVPVGCDDSTSADDEDTALDVDVSTDVVPGDVDMSPGDTADMNNTDVNDAVDADVDTLDVGDSDALDMMGDMDVMGDVEMDMVMGVCRPVNPLGYGECATPLGFAFTGMDCEPISGCDCAPDCGQFYDYVAACRGDCLGCDETKLRGAGIGRPPTKGSFCDELDICVDVAWHRDIVGMFPDAVCEASASFGCPGTHHCRLPPVSAGDRYPDVCQASRFDGVTGVVCTVYGP